MDHWFETCKSAEPATPEKIIPAYLSEDIGIYIQHKVIDSVKHYARKWTMLTILGIGERLYHTLVSYLYGNEADSSYTDVKVRS